MSGTGAPIAPIGLLQITKSGVVKEGLLAVSWIMNVGQRSRTETVAKNFVVKVWETLPSLHMELTFFTASQANTSETVSESRGRSTFLS
jgi:hypothetical protein